MKRLAAGPITRPWVGYIRVSTQEQSEEGVSLEAQRAHLEAWAKLKGVTLLLYADPGFSAGTLDRPALNQVLLKVKTAEIAGIVVTKLDRFSRSSRDILNTLHDLERAGVQFASIKESFDTSTAMGRAVLQIMAAIAELERGLISERTTDALQHKAARLDVYGKIPFGFDGAAPDLRGRPTKLIPNAYEQQVLAEMRAQRDKGMSLSEIAKRLNEAGVLPKHSRKGLWDHSAVRYLLETDRAVDRAARTPPPAVEG